MSNKLECSFRDPSGFLFKKDDILYRQINYSYKENYNYFKSSGLYNELVELDLLVRHEEVDIDCLDVDGYLIIKPVELPVISYPYEWSFSQLKEAALLTLSIQQKALSKGLSLKDASSYNVQFYNGKPIFIDTLSFEKLRPNQPWVAYKQFCQHFLAPLALMAKTDITLNQLLKTNIDGIPLGLASKLLPFTSRFSFSLAIHIHLHAKTQSKNADKEIDPAKFKSTFSINSFYAIIDSLKTAVLKLKWEPIGTEWHDYYDSNNNYDDESLSLKNDIVKGFLDKLSIRSVWDLGANTGIFSKLAAKYSEYVCAWDIDPACVELNYRAMRDSETKNIYPLLLDLTNPSSAIGWNHKERFSLKERGPVDVTLALGLIHHLVISNNLSLEMIARFLSEITFILIIEFVPKSDSQIKKLLRNREDIFPNYHIKNFELVFSQYFKSLDKKPILNTDRTLYLMQVL
ncbi:MAG: ribosomal protein L11 methylase PrmA [Gammaproteobacteria bacterium]|jgi:ribosomal protein L11 methylase PrmA